MHQTEGFAHDLQLNIHLQSWKHFLVHVPISLVGECWKVMINFDVPILLETLFTYLVAPVKLLVFFIISKKGMLNKGQSWLVPCYKRKYITKNLNLSSIHIQLSGPFNITSKNHLHRIKTLWLIVSTYLSSKYQLYTCISYSYPLTEETGEANHSSSLYWQYTVVIFSTNSSNWN